MSMVDGIGGWAGGAELLAGQIARQLDPERFQSTFCVTRLESSPHYDVIRESFELAGVKVIELRRSATVEVGEWRRLVSYMRSERIDVLHTHMLGSNFWGAVLSPMGRVPVYVAQEHGWSFEGTGWRRWVDRHVIARRADAFVTVSREDERRMIEVEKIPAHKLRFIPSGISTPAAPSGADVRSELGIAADAPLVGVVAGLRAPKALDIFIRAVDELRRKHAGLRALIVGNPDASGEDKRLLDLMRELSLEDTLMFTGLRRDVPDVLAAMDVAVLSSDHEGSPLSVMEYMEAARPVVATNVGGIPDLVVDGVTGILVPPRDPTALAAAISGLLDDPDLRRRLGEAGRARRRSEFDISNTVRRVEDLYEELYALKRPD